MSAPLFGTPIAPAFRWFAWRPVRTGDRGWRWLRPVWRQRYQSNLSLPGPIYQWWHHDCAPPHRTQGGPMSTTRTIVYGASDDLLELDGTISEEFDSDQDEGRIIGFSHGVLLRVTCDDDGIWRIIPLRGQEHVEIVFARGEDAGRDDDGCPGYSDKAIVTGEHSWAVVGERWEAAR